MLASRNRSVFKKKKKKLGLVIYHSNCSSASTGNHLKMLACENVSCFSSASRLLSLVLPPAVLVYPCVSWLSHLCKFMSSIPGHRSLHHCSWCLSASVTLWLHTFWSTRTLASFPVFCLKASKSVCPAWFFRLLPMLYICYPVSPEHTWCSTLSPVNFFVFCTILGQ